MAARILMLVAISGLLADVACATEDEMPEAVVKCNEVVEEADRAERPAAFIAGAIETQRSELDQKCRSLLVHQLATHCEAMGSKSGIYTCAESLTRSADLAEIESEARVELLWNTLTLVADSYGREERLADEAAALDQLSDLLAASGSGHHWYESTLVSRRADLHRRQGQFDKAETLYRDLLQQAGTGDSGGLGDRSMLLFALAGTYEDEGRLGDATRTLDQVISDIERVEGSESPTLLLALERKARVAKRMGDEQVASDTLHRIQRIEAADEEDDP